MEAEWPHLTKVKGCTVSCQGATFNMIFKAFFIMTLLSSAMGFFWTNKWVRYCRKGYTSSLQHVDCDSLGSSGMIQCLRVDHYDQTLATVIRHCPSKLPEGDAFDKYANRLYVNNLPRAFRAYISHGRCARLSHEVVQQLLSSFVNNNSVRFVRALVKHCIVGDSAWNTFLKRAELQGRSEMMIVVRATHPLATAAVAGSASEAPAGYSGRSLAALSDSASSLGSGQHSDDEKHITYGSETSGTTGGMYTGPLLHITAEEVRSNMNILSKLGPRQAHKFGLLSDGCLGLTEMHFKQPAVRTQTVALLPLSCFQKIPPKAFAGLNASMVAKIRWWPYVSRDQIKYVASGDTIRALPFDMLGMGRQKSADDKIHPCWNITKEQRESIRKDWKVRREYNRRCIKSAASVPVAAASFASLLLAVGLAIFTLL